MRDGWKMNALRGSLLAGAFLRWEWFRYSLVGYIHLGDGELLTIVRETGSGVSAEI